MPTSYWDKVLRGRISRRRAIATSSGVAFSAAFLAACGGDDDSGSTGSSTGSTTGSSGSTGSPSGSTGTQSGLQTLAEDTRAQARPGGTLITTNPQDPPSFDPHLSSLPAAASTSLLFNKLLSTRLGVLQPTDGATEPDLAESWEFSPDNLTLTLKIRPDAGTPDGAPLNGRKLDADDVVFSWNRWAESGNNRRDLVNAVNPVAPVLSLEATDKSTVVLKLASPTASLLTALSSSLGGQFFIIPREADGGFDVAKEPHGGGAYFLEEYTPSVGLKFARNPNGYDKQAYPDRIETPIISETAQVTAQLMAGNIHTHYTNVSPDSVVQIKKDQPKIGLYQWPMAYLGAGTFFGFKAEPAESTPFRDERVRQAWFYAMDRDLFIETFANVPKFAQDGLEVTSAYFTSLDPSTYTGWWLDPQGPDFGENAKYYNYNLEESKALLSAAGHPDGLDTVSHEAAGNVYGLAYPNHVEVMLGMAAEAGFRIDRQQHQSPAPWNSDYRDARGYFDGVGFRLAPTPAEPREHLFALWNSAGSLNFGFNPEGKGIPSPEGPFTGDPTADELTSKLRGTFDNDEAIALAHDLQRYLAPRQYFNRALGAATSFNVAWPRVKNFAVFQGPWWGYLWKNYWIDETLPPL